MNPLAVHLEISRLPSEDATTDDQLKFLGTLLHERHHWLQYIGSTSGVFNWLLLELQTGILFYLPFEKITEKDLPLITSQWGSSSTLLFWERLEATRRLYFGCRTGDFSALINDRRGPIYTELSEGLKEIIEFLVQGNDSARSSLRSWEQLGDGPASSPYLLRDHGWLVGAKHLMEGAARMSEMYRIIEFGMRYSDTKTEYDMTALWTGIYAVTRRVFFEAVGKLTPAAEVGLAFASDLVLNQLCPPLVPAAGVFVHQHWNPGMMFAMISRGLADFDFGREVDLFSPSEVRELIEDLEAHLASKYPITSNLVTENMLKLFGHLRADDVSKELYEFDDRGWPAPTVPGSRLRYLAAISAEAFRIRKELRELFVFPVCHYAFDRANFRSHFERIQPPILSYGNRGIQPTRSERGWIEFFLGAAIQNEIVRGLVMFDVEGIATRIASYISSHDLDQWRASVRMAVHHAVGDPLAPAIWEAAERIAAHNPD